MARRSVAAALIPSGIIGITCEGEEGGRHVGRGSSLRHFQIRYNSTTQLKSHTHRCASIATSQSCKAPEARPQKAYFPPWRSWKRSAQPMGPKAPGSAGGQLLAVRAQRARDAKLQPGRRPSGAASVRVSLVFGSSRNWTAVESEHKPFGSSSLCPTLRPA